MDLLFYNVWHKITGGMEEGGCSVIVSTADGSESQFTQIHQQNLLLFQ